MAEVLGTTASIVQLVHTSVKLLSFACDFYETHHRIDRAERGLKEDLKTLLQLCKDVGDMFRRYIQGRNVEPAEAPSKSQLLQMALENLVADVKVFNKKVDQLQVSRTRFSRTFRMMWNRTEWEELNTRITSHRVNIGLALNMLSIDLGQAKKFETRIAYKEASAKMTALRKRQQSRQSQSQSQSQSHSRSRSLQRSLTPHRNNAVLLEMDYNAFCNLAEQVFQDVSDAVGTEVSSNRINSLSTVPPELGNLTSNQLSQTQPSSDRRATNEGSANASMSPGTRQTTRSIPHHAEGMLDRLTLSEAAQEDRRQARSLLRLAEMDSEHGDRVSRRGQTELEKARSYQENAIHRMSQLQMTHKIGTPTADIVDMWTVLADINELDNKKSDAIDNLINLLALELDKALSIRIKLKIARLSYDTENYDVAFNLAHKSYDAARSLWRQTSTGISEVILSLDLLIDLHREDDTLVGLFTKRRRTFEAWGYISERHSEFARYLHEYSESPLTWAASRGYDIDVAELLKMNPGLAPYKSASAATPLIAAAHEKHIAVVKALLEDCSTEEGLGHESQRIDINEVDSSGDSALHAAQMPPSIAFDERCPEEDWRDVAGSITELLLQHNADLSCANNLGQSALHLAAEQGNCAVMERLLNDGRCLLDSKDCSGSTLLHMAIERGRFDMVKLLVRKGADITIKDDKDRNALKLAKDPILGTLRNDNIITLLRKERKIRNKQEGAASISTISDRGAKFNFWSKRRHNLPAL